MPEKHFVSLMTGVGVGCWCWWIAHEVNLPAWPIAIGFGLFVTALSYVRYARGHKTESIPPDGVSRTWRAVTTAGWVLSGPFWAWLFPLTDPNLPRRPTQVACLIITGVCAVTNWRHPALFFRNRRF